MGLSFGRLRRRGIAVPKIDPNRRAFLANSFSLAANAGVHCAGFSCAHTYAQTPPKPIRRSGRYEDSFITERRSFKWPGNNTLAVWFAPDVEVWHYNSAFGVGVAPNPTNYYLTSTTTPGANTGCGSACGASRMCSTKPA